MIANCQLSVPVKKFENRAIIGKEIDKVKWRVFYWPTLYNHTVFHACVYTAYVNHNADVQVRPRSRAGKRVRSTNLYHSRQCFNLLRQRSDGTDYYQIVVCPV